jgi:hypothetical protein
MFGRALTKDHRQTDGDTSESDTEREDD